MGIKLDVRTNSAKYKKNPQGFKNKDECAVTLKAFCDVYGIPYSDVFVSIAVLLEGSDLKKGRAGTDSSQIPACKSVRRERS
jgi:hypothetical protein